MYGQTHKQYQNLEEIKKLKKENAELKARNEKFEKELFNSRRSHKVLLEDYDMECGGE